jgi:FlaA1/EpsC-like NDP-sugar epimerase
MVLKVIYVFLPILFAVGLLRRFRECQWGHCKSKSSLNGKVFIVTGANSGIGKETVRELARRKARVVMACRDLENAKNAIEDIRRDVSSGELVSVCFSRWFTLDSAGFIV